MIDERLEHLEMNMEIEFSNDQAKSPTLKKEAFIYSFNAGKKFPT